MYVNVEYCKLEYQFGVVSKSIGFITLIGLFELRSGQTAQPLQEIEV